MIKTLLLGTLIKYLLLMNSMSVTLGHTGSYVPGYCEAYCDQNGLHVPGKWCISDKSPMFCCGDRFNRRCCDDKEKEVYFPPQSTCPKNHWWFYQRVIVGLLTSLVIILIMAACCYYCYSEEGYRHHRRRARRRNRFTFFAEPDPPSRTATLSSCSTSSVPNILRPIPFDPHSPYAFEPPDYDSLPKDPPNYIELYGTEGPLEGAGATERGPISTICDNIAFMNDMEGVPMYAPPVYQLSPEVYSSGQGENNDGETPHNDERQYTGDGVPVSVNRHGMQNLKSKGKKKNKRHSTQEREDHSETSESGASVTSSL